MACYHARLMRQGTYSPFPPNTYRCTNCNEFFTVTLQPFVIGALEETPKENRNESEIDLSLGLYSGLHGSSTRSD